MSRDEPRDEDEQDREEGSGRSLLRPAPLKWKSSDSILGDQKSSAPILGDTTAPVRDADLVPTVEEAVPEPAPYEEPALPAAAETAERAARWLLLAAVFLVPVVFHAETVDAFSLAKMTALWVCLVSATGAWVVGLLLAPRRVALPRGPIVLSSLVLFGITVIATAFSPNRGLSFFGLYHRYEGLVSLALFMWVVLLIVVLYRRVPSRVRELVTALGVAAAVVSVYVVAQSLGLDPFEWRGATGAEPSHPIGALGNSAFTASFLGIAVPMVLYLFLSAATRATRIVWMGTGGFLFVSLLVTQGRGGMLAALAGVGVLLVFKTHLRSWTKVVAVVGGLLLALGLLPLVAPGLIDPPGSDASVPHRTDIWNASVRTLADRPLFGWGPESFYGQYPRFRTATEAREQGLSLSDKPQNIFLSWATSTGLAGLVAYLLMIALALRAVTRRVAARDRPEGLLLATLGAGLVAYLVQGLYSVDIPPLAFTGWLLVAGIAASDEVSAGRLSSADVRPTQRSWGPIAPAGVVAIAAALSLSGLGPLRADHAAWEAERRARSGWSPSALELYESAIALNPRESAYLGLLAFYLERAATDADAAVSPRDAGIRAANLYERASSAQPGNLQFMIGAARAYLSLGEQVDERYFAEGDRCCAGRRRTIPVTHKSTTFTPIF